MTKPKISDGQSAGYVRPTLMASAGDDWQMDTVIESLREALAGAIRALVAEVNRAGDSNNWDFTPDSPAVTDWDAHERASGWGDEPLQDAYRTGAILWYVVNDQALAVADLLDSARSLALLSASRPLGEAAARSWLLLTTSVDPDERIRRMINERLYALHEDWRYTSAVAALDSSWQMVTANRLLDVAESEHHLATERPTNRRAGWVGEQRISTMALLGETIGNSTYAAMFYRDTSGITHATLNVLLKHLEFRSPAPEKYRARLRDIAPAEATAQISASLSALCVASRALLTQTGWDASGYEIAERALLAIQHSILASAD